MIEVLENKDIKQEEVSIEQIFEIPVKSVETVFNEFVEFYENNELGKTLYDVLEYYNITHISVEDSGIEEMITTKKIPYIFRYNVDTERIECVSNQNRDIDMTKNEIFHIFKIIAHEMVHRDQASLYLDDMKANECEDMIKNFYTNYEIHAMSYSYYLENGDIKFISGLTRMLNEEYVLALKENVSRLNII